MKPAAFRTGMALLSGAFDWDGFDPTQAKVRQETYWQVLKDELGDDVWCETVARCIKTLARFPKVAEILRVAGEIRAERPAPALPPPAIVPTTPERTRYWLARIRETVRAVRGPLAGPFVAWSDKLPEPGS